MFEDASWNILEVNEEGGVKRAATFWPLLFSGNKAKRREMRVCVAKIPNRKYKKEIQSKKPAK